MSFPIPRFFFFFKFLINTPAKPTKHNKNKNGYSAQQVASNIVKATGIKSLGYVYPGGITATTKTNLKVIIRYVAVVITVFWTM